MTERTSKQTVQQAVADFDSIKEAILGHKIDVPYPTKTSEYAGLIANIRVGCVAGKAYCSPIVSVCDILLDSAEIYGNGRIVNTLVGTAEVVEE